MSSFTVKAEFEEQADSAGFATTDTTGMFHPTRNPTGWEGSNPTLASVTAANLIVTKPDRYTLLPSGTPVIIDVSSVLPNIAGEEFTVTAAMLGYTDGKLPDGAYDITLRYTTPSGDYSFRQKQVFFSQVCCCVQSLAEEVNLDECKKNTQKYRDASEATKYIIWLRAAWECYELNRTLEWLKELQSICARNPCKNC